MEQHAMPRGLKSAPKSSHQFSIRSFMALTAVIAVWLWLFREITPTELTIFTSFAVVTGVIAHLIYAFVMTWRIAGVLSVLLIYNLALVLLTLVGAGLQNPVSASFDAIFHVLISPAEMITHANSFRDRLFSTVMVAGTLLFTPAHALRPNFISAVVTSMGVGIWYVAGILFLSHAA
jgi:hypothetical protein